MRKNEIHVSAVVCADAAATCETLSDHQILNRIAPAIIRSVNVKSRRGNVYVAEERLAFGRRIYLCMIRHQSEPPRSHTLTVIGGDAKGSTITETFEQTGEQTRIEAIIVWKTGLRGMRSPLYTSYHTLLDAVREKLES